MRNTSLIKQYSIRKTKHRVLAAALALLLALPAASLLCPQEIALAEETQEESVNFALVMDASATMSSSDKNGYSKSAIQMCLDMLPVENADAGVIAFGHNNSGDAYDFTSALAPTIAKHANYVHTIADMTDLSDADAKEDVKAAVDAMKWNGDQTLIDAGLLAGVDMLDVSDTAKDKGCVILLTDGDYKNYLETGRDDEHDLATAISKLNAEGWYVYCIELDYANDASARDSAHSYLTGNITNKCNGETYQCASAEDVAEAFMNILNNFYESGQMTTVTTDSDGSAVYDFAVEGLTSEANITVGASSIQGVELSKGDTSITIGDFDGDGKSETSYNSKEYVVSTGKNYYNIKMIVPEAGDWTLKIRAGASKDITVNEISFSNLTARSEISPESNTEEEPLTKADLVNAKLYLTYEGQSIKEASLGDAKAYLHVTNETTGDVAGDIDMEWKDEDGCFEAEVAVAELGRAGQLKLWTEVDYGGNSVSGKPVTLYTYNEPASLIEGASLGKTEGYVRTTLDPISIENLINNPDSDVLSFKYEGSEDCDVTVELNEDKTQILIYTGTMAGDYEGTLYAWDADMGEEGALAIPMSIKVLNHPMDMKTIGNLDMAAEGVTELSLDLNDYFSDEDQETIEYQLETEENDCLTAELEDGSILHLVSISDGQVAVTITAYDDDGSAKTQTFTVTATTEASIEAKANAILIRNVILAVIAVIILALILYVILSLKKHNTMIRGSWQVSVKAGEDSLNFILDTDGGDVALKDRRKASLWQLFDPETLAQEPATEALKRIRPALEQVEVLGVYKANGCLLINQEPANQLLVNGTAAAKGQSLRLESGEAELTVPSEGGADVVIRITL